MAFIFLSRAVAFVAFAAVSLTPAAAQTRPSPERAPNALVSCPMYGNDMHGGMNSGMMNGQGPGAMDGNRQQMTEQMQAMRQQMEAMHEEMVKLREEMHRQR